jgi:phage N-6-adenine-methyltransferase
MCCEVTEDMLEAVADMDSPPPTAGERTDIQVIRPGRVTVFDPTNTRARLADLEGDIAKFRQLRDWPKLMEAVNDKVAEQEGFVHWWDGPEGVRDKGGPKGYTDVSLAGHRLWTADEAAELTGFDKQQVSRWRVATRPSNIEKYRERLFGGAYRPAFDTVENHRAQGTGENEWFTPEEYLEAARAVLGSIDLDPASNDIAQRVVRAATYYTKEDNGLDKPWKGNVWLNPPYSQPLIGQFGERLVSEYMSGTVPRAIMLTHNYTDTAWFHAAEREATLICFTRGRIKFVDASGDECNPTQGQAFFYYGNEPEIFRDVFERFGFIR